MNPKQANYLIITLTFCLAFLAWGTIIVLRQVTDVNYHTPTAQQLKVQAYKDCTGGYSSQSGDCTKLVDGK